MIAGIVTSNLEAIVRLHVEDGQGQTQAFDMKIDTGFSDFLSLPIATVKALGLIASAQESVEIADGSTVRVDVYSTVVLWDGRPRRVDVHALGVDRLIGMGLLAGHDLAMRIRDGGTVSITFIP
jgi:clan AA aspartic protease